MRKLCAVFALSLLTLAAAASGAQDSGESLPKLISHADAQYPAIARTAHVMGDVVVKITTDGQSVVDAQAESGPPLLRKAAEDNAKTWKFEWHASGTFHVTYRFDLTASEVLTSFPDCRGVVEVRALAQVITGVSYAWGDLGKWKAEFKSPHGRFSNVFEFLDSGPNDEWLRVETPGWQDREGDAKVDDDEFSHKDGDFLIFSMKFAEPDGKRLETYVTGKMSGDKIVGTFVDESGVGGTWTATRIPDAEKK